jgi:hypothetical protein
MAAPARDLHVADTPALVLLLNHSMQSRGGNVKNAVKIQTFAALVLLGAGGFLAGCKSAPDLTQDQAKTMIQANYDQSAGTPFNIAVDDTGMQKGVHAKYWSGVKSYPNGYWGDFKLSPDGVKLI